MPETDSSINPWIVAATVILPALMEVLDTSIVNVALPHMQGSFSATQDQITWVLTSYLVANGIVLPMTGWLSRVFGRKNFLISCVVIFTASSFMCGASTTLSMIVFFRIVQGISGGALQPMSQSILLETFPAEQQGMAMALWGVGIVTAPVIAPLLGGWITDHYSWRWVFYINIPVGLLAFFMTRWFITDPHYAKKQKVSFDSWGIIFLALAVGALQIMLDKGQKEDWFDSRFIIYLAIISGVAFIALIIREFKAEEPVVDLDVFKNRTFSAGTFTMFLFGFGIYAWVSLIPLYVQNLMGYTATESGLVISPRGAGVMVTMFIAGWYLRKGWDARWILLMAMPFLIIAGLDLVNLNLNAGFTYIAIPNFTQGLGLGLIFVPLASSTMSKISPDKMGNATGIFNLARNIGGSIGIATTQTLLARFSQQHQNYLVSNINPYNPVFRQKYESILHGLSASAPDITSLGHLSEKAMGIIYGMIQKQAAMLAYIDVYWLVTLMFLLMIPSILMMKPRKGESSTAVH